MQDSPTVEHTGLYNFTEDEAEPSSPGVLPNWVASAKLIHKALLLVMAGLLLAALAFCGLPLLRPVGGLMLQRLWDVLRFLFLTTGIGLGILNSSRPSRGGSQTEHSKAKEDNSVNPKVPFAGMFYGEMQPSYSNSFADRDVDMIEGAVMSRSSSRNDGGTQAAVSSTEALGMAEKDVGNGAIVHTEGDMVGHIRTGSKTSDDLKGNREGTASHVDAVSSQSLDNDDVDASSEHEGKSMKHHEVGLAAVMAGSEKNSAVKRGKIVHRRGSSLMEIPLEEEQEYWVGSKFSKDDMVTNLRHRRLQASDNPILTGKAPSLTLYDAARKGRNVLDGLSKKASESAGSISLSRKVPPTMAGNVLVDVKRKESEVPTFSGNIVVDSVDRKVSELSVTTQPPSINAATSRRTRHARSRSELDMNELLVKQQQPIKSKPTTSSQLSRRRNASLSCDLDKEFTKTGTNTSSVFTLPSPPTPHLMWAMDDDKSMSTQGILYKKEGDSSLRKAFSESLAPWRLVTTREAAPVNVPTADSSSWNKKPMSSRGNSLVEDDGESPSSTMSSPSPGELNKKVDAFIARFQQQMKLQRLESLERARRRRNPY